MAHERMQTSHPPVSSCQRGRFVGKQHPAHVRRALPTLWFQRKPNKMRQSKRHSEAAALAAVGTPVLAHCVLCLCDCRCLEVADRQGAGGPFQRAPEAAVLRR